MQEPYFRWREEQQNRSIADQPEAGAFLAYEHAARMLPDADRAEWEQLNHFLWHDARHVSVGEIVEHSNRLSSALMRLAMTGKLPRETMRAEHPYPDEWQAFYRDALEDLPALAAQARLPHAFAEARVNMELGQPVATEEVDLRAMLRSILRSLQLRFGEDDYVLLGSSASDPARNRLELSGDATVTANPGMLWSVLYNLLKNAAKECAGPKDGSALFDRVTEGRLPARPSRISVNVERVPQTQTVLVHILDNGKGLSVDEILGNVKQMQDRHMLASANHHVRGRVRKLMGDWVEGDPYAIRKVSMGDVYDLAALSRLSGFVTRERTKSDSSGLGLWGATYLADRMCGKVLWTNTADAGALFTVVLPEKFEPTRKRAITRETRSVVGGILEGKRRVAYRAA